jgi:p-aminobenzoyl-glutamate transporter AbgT
MEWFFSGLGTTIITLIVGLVAGGTVGYKIGINKKTTTKQKQKAGDNSSQVQIGRDYNGR